MKAYGGLRRTMMRALQLVQLHAYVVSAAYNLLRISRLQPATRLCRRLPYSALASRQRFVSR
jgi:hypothetical protein